MPSKVPIRDRITEALKQHGGTLSYHALAVSVFPREDYPNAFNYPTRGGPPGCYRALSKALRENGFQVYQPPGCNVTHAEVTRGRGK